MLLEWTIITELVQLGLLRTVVPVFIGELICENNVERLGDLFESPVVKSLSQKVHVRVNSKAESILRGLDMEPTSSLHSRSVKDVVEAVMSHKGILAEEHFVPLLSSQGGLLHNREACMRNLVRSVGKELMAIAAREACDATEAPEEAGRVRRGSTRSSLLWRRAFDGVAARIGSRLSSADDFSCVDPHNIADHSSELRNVRKSSLGEFARLRSNSAVNPEVTVARADADAISDAAYMEQRDELAEMKAEMEAMRAHKDAEIAMLRAEMARVKAQSDAEISKLRALLAAERANAQPACSMM